ncbi:alpha/beta-hydrolase [Macrolepiota fuliginosa MF-IS2]|uniref:Alpha/beta-hydrolase n=1 Tax=Macrolepiota fuliginosa MF-IS2 TaxID=1400762 RepID=A0A9P5X9X2_9AGAR|nr:alpha/beta-hydrolase [Macrolepiota fuliginosa MF-IS2]
MNGHTATLLDPPSTTPTPPIAVTLAGGAPPTNGVIGHAEVNGVTKHLGTNGRVSRAAGDDTRILVSADGTQIYVNAVGDPSKQAIVFIHGIVWSLMAFDDIFCDPDWTSRLYLVRYDVRGHGRSGKPSADEGWASERFAEDFGAVVDAFKLEKPIVAGWSLGATHLVDILSAYPVDYLRGIINISGITYIDDTVLDRFGTPGSLEWIGQMAGSPNVEEFQAGAVNFIDGCCRTLPYEVRRACLGNIMTQPQSIILRSLTRKQNVETFGNVGRTMLPCLVIYGDSDELIAVHKLPEYHKEWRNVTVEVVEGGSHVPWSKTAERPAALFKEKALRWVDSVMESRL